ncbi:pentatricopeptide repeat-containing protein, mitochondrial [Iris pallida]|uniref:Pentatricopeptide repeat-containing protein, mitochondrial n=1 Tax=Iris pallida TaxID=29817 RepID=A0AAX6GG61_IRIPA|nr:pentatricopeptide repeat-containing protein, mitochondrial [Iris pallida]
MQKLKFSQSLLLRRSPFHSKPLSSAAAVDVEKIYRILRRYHTDPAKLASVLRSSSVPFPFPSSLVDRVLLRIGPSPSLALPFLSSVVGVGDDSSVSPRALLSVLSRSRHLPSALALLDLLRLRSPHLLSPDLFLPLLRRFAKSKSKSSNLTHHAIQLLDKMPQTHDNDHSPLLFSCLLDALAKNDSVKDAAKLFEEMKEKFPPTLKNFTSLLYGWCRAGKLDEAKYVLVQIKDAGFDPDVVVYNILLSGFCSAGKIEDAHELLSEMRRKKGCEPNVISYTTLIQALCSRERMDEAMRVFVEMRRDGCEADIVTYSTLVGGFAKCGKVDRALDVLDGMAGNGCRPNPATYFPIFVALEKEEDLEGCWELMGRMRKGHCLPDLGIYNVMIRLSCRLGETERALEIWDEMEMGGLAPGLDTFVIMVHGLLGQGSLIEACKYFRDMVGRGLLSVPQYGILKDLLNSLLRAGKLELAIDLWGLIVSKGGELNVCAWTIWIHALFSNKHVKEACDYCLEMMEAGLMPQPDTFAKLMKGLKRLYNRALAAEITEKARVMAAERNVTFKMYKRRGVIDLEKKMKKKKKKEQKKGKEWKGRSGTGSGRRRGGRDSPLSFDNEESSIP